METVEYTTSWDEEVKLALFAESYAEGGLAIGTLNVTDPDDEESYLQVWNYLTVNLPHDPLASEWCKTPGNIVIDTGAVAPALADALLEKGVISLEGRSSRSGFGSYPLATVSPKTLRALRGMRETAQLATSLQALARLTDRTATPQRPGNSAETKNMEARHGGRRI